ncbi:MAG TPA: ATP-binding protein [Candidatus Sabulitectum sp.]|nr:ATP-binding protein [Candidatus Sabulitectum sp.]HPF32297.1 ATP-binding protein [Candidatus Sabulitectum sp.]HPJ27822.1 ATP-binding protein [Candidatus Sabulitectum sp.]HPR21966.1 ATP-binding protein [Candidatus Sabulitectum sp.]
MHRYALANLLDWKDRGSRKPLVIRGARQTGKTWLMKTFGKTCYERCAYINFDGNPRMKALFEMDFDTDRLLTGLQVEADCRIEPGNTLILFDEIQQVPEALSSLKYFYENAPELNIVSAGSLLGVAMHSGASFPVGKVEFLDLHPMSFSEFLLATGSERLAGLLREGNFEMTNIFSSEYRDKLRSYFLVGGMPEAVLEFRRNMDYGAARSVQMQLLTGYEQDFSKHSPAEVVPRIRSVWNSLPSQLARENRKFVWGLVRNGARAREYESAIQWLLDCGVVTRVNRVTRPGIPLAGYRDLSAFKLFALDVGLLSAMGRIQPSVILEGNRVFMEFKGALTEQFVLQQLLSLGIEPSYWSAAKGNAEIDFLLQMPSGIIPLEVKAAENLQAKSLRVYSQKYSPERSIRCSLSNFRDEGWLINLPLYCIECIGKISTRQEAAPIRENG